MKAPSIRGFRFESPLGFGECGEVFAAQDAKGNPVAVKVFDGLAISRAILKSANSRLGQGGWPVGVMPVLESDFDHRPAYWVTPLVADGQGGGVVPRSLQHQIDSHPCAGTMPIVRDIAGALAAMHHRRVAHANLKPGNVFLSETGGVLLADWAQGNMPGVAGIRFTDAVLYQPPEQLRDPEGHLQEAGYQWDVHAFGVLAFRLLTGKFPRCHAIFMHVVPPQGETRRDDIDADLAKVAANLEASPPPSWPCDPVDEFEAGVREWIDRCLALDPARRPGSMAEVAAGIDRVDQEIAARREHQRMLDQRRRAGRRELHAWAASAAAVVLAMLWLGKRDLLESERGSHARTVARLTGDLAAANAGTAAAESARDAAESARDGAEADANAAREEAASERETAHARLRAARDVGDRLFAWAIEQDRRQLPPLDGRMARLDMLEASLDAFLADTGAVAGLESERAAVRLQLAEIALARGDAKTAASRFAALPDDARPPAIRMARNLLALALLQDAAGDESARATFDEARGMLESAGAAADADRRRHLTAILDFQDAKHLTAEGDDVAALERLTAATRALNQLADERADAIFLRSELAAGRLATAAAFDAIGLPDEARETRGLAAAELRKLLESSAGDTSLMLELAGCLGAMAESSVLEGKVAEALEKNTEATGLLDAVLARDPENPVAIPRMAAQLGLRADILRDEGKSDEAREAYGRGINMLTALCAARPGDGMATYRLALLTWQKARMAGFDDDRSGEIAMLRDAAALMEKSASTPGGPPARQARVSTAYLHGDLGHALEMAKDKPGAIAAFTTSRDHWKDLSAAHPDNEEFTEALAWCERRLGDLRR